MSASPQSRLGRVPSVSTLRVHESDCRFCRLHSLRWAFHPLLCFCGAVSCLTAALQHSLPGRWANGGSPQAQFIRKGARHPAWGGHAAEGRLRSLKIRPHRSEDGVLSPRRHLLVFMLPPGMCRVPRVSPAASSIVCFSLLAAMPRGPFFVFLLRGSQSVIDFSRDF